MPGPFKRFSWIARWKWAALFNRHRFSSYHLGDYCIYLNVSESLMMYQCARGEYDAAKRRLLENTLKPGACFVDVGANMGYFALFAASLTGEEGRVLAVEPEPNNCRWILASARASGFAHLNVIQAAISDTSGEALLHLGRKSGWHTLNPGQRNRDRGRLKVKTLTMDALTADLHRVDCIKIDVEGHEHAVLAGAAETLRRHRPVVLLDTHPQLGARLGALEVLLRGQGYYWRRLGAPDKPLEQMPREPAELVLKPA